MRRPAALLPLLLLLIPARPAGAEVMARVNGREITRQMVEDHLRHALGSEWSKLKAKELADAKKSVIEQLIRTELVEQEVASFGMEIAPSEVAEKIGEMRATIKRRYGGKITLEQELRKNYSYVEFLARMTRSSIALYRFIERGTTEAHILRYYKEHPNRFQKLLKARHILLPTIDLTTRLPLPKAKIAAARAQADALRKELAAGADFAALAQKHSQCPSKQRGGDLGWFNEKRMVPEFWKALAGLAKGELGPAFKTRFGYHVAQLTDRKAPTWRDAREPCIFARQEEYMKKLLKAAKIERLK